VPGRPECLELFELIWFERLAYVPFQRCVDIVHFLKHLLALLYETPCQVDSLGNKLLFFLGIPGRLCGLNLLDCLGHPTGYIR